ncbi:hypothetical protein KCU61_g269, partial [Aureobasidium melanogenum]
MADRRRHLPSLCCACAVDLCRLAGPSVLSTYAFACKRGGGWVASLSGVTGTALVAALSHVNPDKLFATSPVAIVVVLYLCMFVVLRFPTETATVQGALFPTVWGELFTHAAHVSNSIFHVSI